MKWSFIFILLCLQFKIFSQVELEWSLLYTGINSLEDTMWYDVGKKGSVQDVLIRENIMPDPFWKTNGRKFEALENKEWVFRSIFFIKEEQFNKELIEIEFPCVDTYAKIYLNDRLLVETNNFFRPYRFEIKDFLLKGSNEIEIHFIPPVLYYQDKTKSDTTGKWKLSNHKLTYDGVYLPAPNDEGKIKVAPYTRKPQYQFGWDWTLRMNTMGLPKPVKIYSYDHFRIINKTVNVLSIKDNHAEIEIILFLQGKKEGEILWDSNLFGKERVTIKDGEIRRKIKIQNPKLWWPKGYGEPFLYMDTISLYYENKQQETLPLKFGVKTSELVMEKDEWGTSYYFLINGKRVFCKGANYIPQEVFPSKVNDSSMISLVKEASRNNFNILRVWGGGYYPDEVFFEKCDELGIMVWQDCMFACSMYPGDDWFLNNVKEELSYQIPRIASHPSVVLINGNNEVFVAWKYWGFQIRYGLYGEKARKIEDWYETLFQKLIPDIVKESTSIPYVHTSPLSHWGKDEFYEDGSQHYWGVWHGKDPLIDFARKSGRFNAEYGFQSFPEFSTIYRFAEKEDFNIDSEVMSYHQKSYVGNKMILKHARILYGEPKKFEEFVYYSQLTQSKAVSMAIASHRLDQPRCGGTIYWQYNDCWPGPTWSSMDYYGNRKALHYEVKKDFQEVAVLRKYEELNKSSFFIISDHDKSGKLKWKIYDEKGQKILKETEGEFYSLRGNQPALVLSSKDICKITKGKDFIIQMEWAGERESFKRIFNCIDTRKELKKKANYTVNIKEEKLIIENDHLLKDAWIFNKTGKPLILDKNFETLLPGKHVFHIEKGKDIKREEVDIFYR